MIFQKMVHAGEVDDKIATDWDTRPNVAKHI